MKDTEMDQKITECIQWKARHCLSYSRAAVPNLFGTRDWFNGRQFFHGQWGGGAGSGGNASDGE